MAITINGSGTITGISTGGLPDGIIDDGTLATSAVTSTKIADGTITNADINASAAIAGSKVDGSFGKVLQVIQVRNGTRSWSYNMANGNVVAGAVVITPSSTSSKILLFMSHTGERVNANGAGNINSTGLYSTNWYVNASSLSGGQIEQTTGYSYPNNARYNVSGHYLHLPNSTSAQSYDVRITGGSSLTSAYFLFYNITITAIEVGA